MLNLIRRLLGRTHKAEAIVAQQEAQAALEVAQARTPEIEALAGRIEQHGVINHIGARVEAAWRGI